MCNQYENNDIPQEPENLRFALIVIFYEHEKRTEQISILLFKLIAKLFAFQPINIFAKHKNQIVYLL